MKAATLIGAAIFATLALAGLAFLSRDWQAGVPMIAIGVVGAVWLYRIAQRRKAAHEAELKVRNDERFRQLCTLATSDRFELRVRGSSQLGMAIGMTLAAAIGLLLAIASESIGWTLAASLLGALALLFLLRTVPMLGRPKLILSKSGIVVPHVPLVTWEQVEGISLTVNSHKGVVLSHSLVFHVPSLPSLFGRLPWFVRIFHQFMWKAARTRVAVILKASSEHPDVVFRLCRHLWTARTGRDYPWSPLTSDSYNHALRQFGNASARMKEQLAAGKFDEAARLAEQLTDSSRIVSAEVRRQQRIWEWVIAAAIAVFALLAIGAHLWRR